MAPEMIDKIMLLVASAYIVGVLTGIVVTVVLTQRHRRRVDNPVVRCSKQLQKAGFGKGINDAERNIKGRYARHEETGKEKSFSRWGVRKMHGPW